MSQPKQPEECGACDSRESNIGAWSPCPRHAPTNQETPEHNLSCRYGELDGFQGAVYPCSCTKLGGVGEHEDVTTNNFQEISSTLAVETPANKLAVGVRVPCVGACGCQTRHEETPEPTQERCKKCDGRKFVTINQGMCGGCETCGAREEEIVECPDCTPTVTPDGETQVDIQVRDALTVILFELSGQCSSLHRAHPETEKEKGWNDAVMAMLKYMPQPTIKEYEEAIENSSKPLSNPPEQKDFVEGKWEDVHREHGHCADWWLEKLAKVKAQAYAQGEQDMLSRAKEAIKKVEPASLMDTYSEGEEIIDRTEVLSALEALTDKKTT